MRTILEYVLPHVAATVCLVGLAARTWMWLRRPVPFPLTLDGSTRSTASRWMGLLAELAGFRALARADRLLWICAWTMHISLVLVILGHVAGIGLLTHQFVPLGASPQTSQWLSATLGSAVGLGLGVALAALFVRRLVDAQLRRLADLPDYFDLLLLLAIAVTGLLMRVVGPAIDLAAVRHYLAGLMTFHPTPLPREPLFVAHFVLVNLLLVWLPFSKLVHLTGAVISRALVSQSPPQYPDSSSPRNVPFLVRPKGDMP